MKPAARSAPARRSSHRFCDFLRLDLGRELPVADHEVDLAAAREAPGWKAQHWTKTVPVSVTTLDALIGKHGAPAFIKIDVEGAEPSVLEGMAAGLRAGRYRHVFIEWHPSATPSAAP